MFFFMIFDNLKGSIVGTKRRRFFEKKIEKKSKKTSKIATFRHFWGPLRGRSYRHKKNVTRFENYNKIC